MNLVRQSQHSRRSHQLNRMHAVGLHYQAWSPRKHRLNPQQLKQLQQPAQTVPTVQVVIVPVPVSRYIVADAQGASFIDCHKAGGSRSHSIQSGLHNAFLSKAQLGSCLFLPAQVAAPREQADVILQAVCSPRRQLQQPI